VLYHLIGRFGPPSEQWRDAAVIVQGKRVIAYAPDEWEATVAIPGDEGAGQKLALDILRDVIDPNMTLESLLIPAEFLPDIEVKATKENGLPVIRGTRLRTAMIRRLADKLGAAVVVRDYYDFITLRNVEACQHFECFLDRAA
jgi:uncharacterized protein (DUF433 family)